MLIKNLSENRQIQPLIRQLIKRHVQLNRPFSSTNDDRSSNSSRSLNYPEFSIPCSCKKNNWKSPWKQTRSRQIREPQIQELITTHAQLKRPFSSTNDDRSPNPNRPLKYSEFSISCSCKKKRKKCNKKEKREREREREKTWIDSPKRKLHELVKDNTPNIWFKRARLNQQFSRHCKHKHDNSSIQVSTNKSSTPVAARKEASRREKKMQWHQIIKRCKYSNNSINPPGFNHDPVGPQQQQQQQRFNREEYESKEEIDEEKEEEDPQREGGGGGGGGGEGERKHKEGNKKTPTFLHLPSLLLPPPSYPSEPGGGRPGQPATFFHQRETHTADW